LPAPEEREVRVVVFSEVKWRYMRTRKGFLIAHFPPDWQILFLEPMNRQAKSHWWPVRDGRVTAATLPVLKPSTTVPLLNRLLGMRIVRGLINLLVWLWTAVLLAGWGRGRPRVFYLSNVLCTPVARRLRRDLFLYDCNDDPLGFSTSPDWVAPYLDQTLRTADVVVSCSRSLARRLLARVDRSVEVIGNGADVERFAAPVEPSRVDPRIRELTRPRIGYAGAISNWFDFELVGEVAGAHAEVPVVLMGPVAPDQQARAAALRERHPNVVMTGAIPYHDLPHQVGELDVCLIPFRRGGETDVLNPNKLYEYLAAGRTVVTLAYSEDIEAFGEWVRIARSREEFVELVGRALTSPDDPVRQRAVGARHGWDARAAEMVALIEAGLSGRRPPVAPGEAE
jgi:glycosyltransferase involved in cell wall biosynthesis